MNILLLGANGQLGRHFLESGGLAARGRLIPASRDGLLTNGNKGEAGDLASPRTLHDVLERCQPQVIINTAAYTAVDRAEQEETLATQINGDALRLLGDWAAAHRALVVHYSTDYVFDGSQQQPYAIDATTAPVSAYGRSKLAGEQALRDSGADHLIFRTAWVYAAHGQNFLRTMLRLGAEREELRVVADQHGTPTSTGLIVDATLAALDRWLQAGKTDRQALHGLHHLVASGMTTWHGFAEAIFDQAFEHKLLVRKPRIVPITTADFPTAARRPAWSVLDNTGFQSRFGYRLADWQTGLRDVMSSISA